MSRCLSMTSGKKNSINKKGLKRKHDKISDSGVNITHIHRSFKKPKHLKQTIQNKNYKLMNNSQYSDNENLLQSLPAFTFKNKHGSILSNVNLFMDSLTHIHPKDKYPLIYCITGAYEILRIHYTNILNELMVSTTTTKNLTIDNTLEKWIRLSFPTIVDRLLQNIGESFQKIIKNTLLSIVDTYQCLQTYFRKEKRIHFVQLSTQLQIINNIILGKDDFDGIDTMNYQLTTNTDDVDHQPSLQQQKKQVYTTIDDLKKSSTMMDYIKQYNNYFKIHSLRRNSCRLIEIVNEYTDLILLKEDMLSLGLMRQNRILHTFLSTKNVNEYHFFQLNNSLLPIRTSLDRLFYDNNNDNTNNNDNNKKDLDESNLKQSQPQQQQQYREVNSKGSFPIQSKKNNLNYLLLSRSDQSCYLIFKKTAWLYMHSFWLPHFNHQVPVYPILLKHWVTTTNSLYTDRARKYNVLFTLLSWLDKSAFRDNRTYIIPPNDPRFIIYDHLFFILNRWNDSISINDMSDITMPKMQKNNQSNGVDTAATDDDDKKNDNDHCNIEQSTYGLQRGIQNSYLFPQKPSMLKAMRDFILFDKPHVISTTMINKLYILFEICNDKRSQLLRSKYPQTREYISKLKSSYNTKRKCYIPIVIINYGQKNNRSRSKKSPSINDSTDGGDFPEESYYITMSLYLLCTSPLLNDKEAMELFLSIGTIEKTVYRANRCKLYFTGMQGDTMDMNDLSKNKKQNGDENYDGLFEPVFTNSIPFEPPKPVKGLKFRKSYMKLFEDRESWLSSLTQMLLKQQQQQQSNINVNRDFIHNDNNIDDVTATAAAATTTMWDNPNFRPDPLYTTNVNGQPCFTSINPVIMTATKILAMIEYSTLLDLSSLEAKDIYKPLIDGIIPEYNRELKHIFQPHNLHHTMKSPLVSSSNVNIEKDKNNDTSKPLSPSSPPAILIENKIGNNIIKKSKRLDKYLSPSSMVANLITDNCVFMLLELTDNTTLISSSFYTNNTDTPNNDKYKKPSKVLFEVLFNQLRYRWDKSINCYYHPNNKQQLTIKTKEKDNDNSLTSPHTGILHT